MAHHDTNDNQAYDFLETDGEEDGPYTADGDIVTDAGTVSVTAAVFADADASDGETIVVESATLHDGGFVTVHDSTLADGDVTGSIRGTSEYLGPGTHTDVEVVLDEPLSEDDTVFAMAHFDTNDNQAYGFVTSDGVEDGPYVAAGGPVMDSPDVSVDDDSMAGDGMDGTDEADDSAMTTDADDPEPDDQPGFGVVAAVVAFLAAGLLAARRLS